jgi:hypothetical protein
VGSPDPEAMRRIAGECVLLVAEQHGRDLDWSLASLGELDQVCAELRAPGPLSAERLDLWAKLVGAYLGEVVIRAHDGRWVGNKQESGPPAILALNVTGHPFSTAYRVLSGEEGKSLASFARALPYISDHARRRSQA